MKPVAVSVNVARPREEVFDFIDVLANHESYMDHMFANWNFSGPAAGVGAKARARVQAPGSREMAEFEVVESERPSRTVEKGVSSHGKRQTRGTYTLTERPDGGTEISFEMAWEQVPRSERILPPLSRVFIRRALGKGMRRLAKQLEKA
ncbi:MAG TPA: SRPBCC family protein [Solirubrobacterales bacterium]|nr:SRPBCC family protein [Solirubrobacterales bacterium]